MYQIHTICVGGSNQNDQQQFNYYIAEIYD